MKNIILTCFVVVLLSCSNNQNSINKTSKFTLDDPFAKTMVKSEFFKSDGSKNNLLESKGGSSIFIPEGAFLDYRGKPVKGSIDIEFAEVYEPVDMILSNVVMSDSSKMYRQEKAFFINATKKGKQLSINPEKPIYIEISAENKPPKLYHGTRRAHGQMVWEEAADPVRYLIPLKLEALDFLPEGFREAVQSGLPYKNHKELSEQLADSLYYSLSTNPSAPVIIYNLKKTDIAELSILNHIGPDTVSTLCGIDPLSIKTIRNSKFQNTLISTREFESRLKTIFKTCDNHILELYIKNLNKNLWEIDSLAAETLGKSHNLYQAFVDFSKLKQTTVKVTDKQAEALARGFFDQRKKVAAEIQKLRNELLEQQERKERIVERKIKEYRKLLQKREEYRMHKFGFELTKTGWYNAAELITLDDLEKFTLNTVVKNGDKFDRAYVYIVNPKIKSIFALRAADNINFEMEYLDDPHLLLWKNQKFNAIEIGFKKGQIAYSISEHTQQPINNVEIELKAGEEKKFREDIMPFTRNYTRENKILIDLEYQDFLYNEQERRKLIFKEKLFQLKLRMKAFPCCDARLGFHDASLEDILNSISFLLDTSFEVKDKSILSMYMTAIFNFNKVSLETILNVISRTLNLTFELQGNKYIVNVSAGNN